jgi:anti-sigma B factor antagonist
VDLHGSIEIVGTVPVLSLTGSVDLATVAELRDLLLRLVADHPGRRVAVDLDGVDALDDIGLGVLLGAAGRTRQNGGDLVVVCASEHLRQRFTLTGLDRAVTVTPTLTADRS